MSNYENDADLATSLLGMSGLKLNMSPLPRKNMKTREILEHRLANYNDDMELKTPYSDPEIEFDGNDVYVRRNGTEFESIMPIPKNCRRERDFLRILSMFYRNSHKNP